MNSLGRAAASKVRDIGTGLEKEASVLRWLHKEVQATVKRLRKEDAGLGPLIDNAYAYALFPAVGKAAAVLGVAYGMGEVLEQGSVIGYAGIVQLTVGVQLGGSTFAEVILFENKESLNRFKQGKLSFSASAAAALVKAAARGASDYEGGVTVLAYSKGGMLLEAAIGAQKFIFKPAVLGRLKSASRRTEARITPKRKQIRRARKRASRRPRP